MRRSKLFVGKTEKSVDFVEREGDVTLCDAPSVTQSHPRVMHLDVMNSNVMHSVRHTSV